MMKLLIPLAFFLLSGLVSIAATFRLPTHLSPQSYDIHILTHLSEEDGYNFEGVERIRVICNKDTKSLVIHSKNLTIDQKNVLIVEANSESRSPLKYSSSEFNTGIDLFIYNVAEPMVAGKEYDILIPFKGELNQDPIGFYRSSYFNLKEQKHKWVAATQFEPTYARRAFPCFDEPEMKATFEISIVHHKDLTALSNMPIKVTNKQNPDYVSDHFEKSVPMSTYLVAFVVHDFSYRESVQKPGDTKFRVWTRRDAIDQAEYANVIGPKCVSFYEDYFDRKYPLPKMDMITIPVFEAGAMENWGLITYKESSLLFKPNVSTVFSQHQIATIVAHELAHQWFGNIVTMKWWNDAWLNESFATYFASLGVSHLHPEWNTLGDTSFEYTSLIFADDVNKFIHPVSVPIEHPNEIKENFNFITYKKGSTIIRMMHLFLGDDTFRYGIIKYLKKHKYGNAEQNDLWESLTKEAHKRDTLPKKITVKQIMDSWTLQSGYPIITVNRNYEKGTADVTQIRYLPETERSKKDLIGCWWIPLSYTNAKELNFNSTKPKDWSKCDSDEKSTTVTINNLPDDKTWVLFNVKLSGLYRVKYDEKNLNLLIDALNGPNYQQIHKMNRAQLIDDVLELVLNRDLELIFGLRLVNYLIQEEDYIPWRAFLDKLPKIKLFMETEMYDNFKECVQTMLTPIYKKTNGLEDVSDNRLEAIKLKSLIAKFACEFDVGDCVERSKKLFDHWMSVENPDEVNPVPLNLRSIVYCTAIRHGGKQEIKFLSSRLKNSNVANEKSYIRAALIICPLDIDNSIPK